MSKNSEDILNKIDAKLDDVFEAIHGVDKEVALQKAAFSARIEQDDKKFEEFKRMNDILQQNTNSLNEHMRRTELLESLVEKMDMRLSPIELDRLEEEAIKKYRKSKLKKYGKVVAIVATALGILAALKPLLITLLGV